MSVHPTGLSILMHLCQRAGEALIESAGHALTRWRDRKHATAETVWAHFRATSVLAHQWISARDAMELTLADCVTALSAIPHEVSQASWELPSIRVSASDFKAAVAAIGQASAPLYLAGLDSNGHLRPTRPLRAWKPALTGPTPPLRIYRAWADSTGRFVAGPDVGITLTTQDLPTHASQADIDVVFTWVDGSDPAWQLRRATRDGDPVGLHPTASNDARFEQNNELRCALSSVERFAPWRRRVFLVTDGQRPTWLHDEFPHVELIRHDQIFADQTALPTFNSHAIESQLHHIQGLAEQWLYFNDDVFLATYAPPSRFFSHGRLAVFQSDEVIPEGRGTVADAPVVAAGKNTRELLSQLLPEDPVSVHKLKHVPHPQLRSLTTSLETVANEAFRQTEHSPFRAPTDLSIASSLAPHYALAKGFASKGEIRHFYADVASPELRWRLPHLNEWRSADVACLNATDRTSNLHEIFTGSDRSPHTPSTEASR